MSQSRITEYGPQPGVIYQTIDQIENDRTRVKKLIESHDENHELKYLILCHGRLHGIPVELKEYWDKSIISDAPRNIYWGTSTESDIKYELGPELYEQHKDDPDIFKADIYIDLTKPIDLKYNWMEEHFDMVITWHCPTGSIFLEKKIHGMSSVETNQYLKSTGKKPGSLYVYPLRLAYQPIENVMWFTKPGGIIWMSPGPLGTTTTKELITDMFSPYADRLSIISAKKHLKLKKIIGNMRAGTYKNYYYSYIKYKSKYLQLKKLTV